MNHLVLSLLICALPAFTLRADALYTRTLQEAAELKARREYAKALETYDMAVQRASTPMEEALAEIKKAHLLTYSMDRHGEAFAISDQVLKVKDLKPVVEVTARQVRARCLIKDGDYEDAAKDLVRGLELEGVDWARPGLILSLGDCHRFTDEPEKAIRIYRRLTDDADMGDKSRGVAWLNIGMTYQYNLRGKDDAREAYRKALSLNDELESGIHVHLESL